MPRSALTGTRIRERREVLGLRQADLARDVGISPSYLNLIEHNRRRIGGKILLSLAAALRVDAAQLSEGAEAGLLAALGDAATGLPGAGADLPRAEEFAGRFPGWAKLVAEQHRRIGALERTVEALTDRLTHDPHLAASLHEVLSTVTAIRSTSAILADDQGLEPDWQERFHRNIYSDSRRLAESMQALVAYLDAGGEAEMGLSSPQEEVEAWLESRGFHLEEMEAAEVIDEMIAAAEELQSTPAKVLARSHAERYRADAARMPLEDCAEVARQSGFDPGAVALRFGVDLAAAMRRLAAVAGVQQDGRVGLVLCDGSGTLTFRKPVEGFPLPRFGAACPLWPLYQALAQPLRPVRTLVEQTARTPQRFLTYAVALPRQPAGFDEPIVQEATMLILSRELATAGNRAQPVGTSCRICPRTGCPARREPSILADGF